MEPPQKFAKKDLIVYLMPYLQREELLRCSEVCRSWAQALALNWDSLEGRGGQTEREIWTTFNICDKESNIEDIVNLHPAYFVGRSITGSFTLGDTPDHWHEFGEKFALLVQPRTNLFITKVFYAFEDYSVDSYKVAYSSLTDFPHLKHMEFSSGNSNGRGISNLNHMKIQEFLNSVRLPEHGKIATLTMRRAREWVATATIEEACPNIPSLYRWLEDKYFEQLEKIVRPFTQRVTVGKVFEKLETLELLDTESENKVYDVYRIYPASALPALKNIHIPICETMPVNSFLSTFNCLRSVTLTAMEDIGNLYLETDYIITSVQDLTINMISYGGFENEVMLNFFRAFPNSKTFTLQWKVWPFSPGIRNSLIDVLEQRLWYWQTRISNDIPWSFFCPARCFKNHDSDKGYFITSQIRNPTAGCMGQCPCCVQSHAPNLKELRLKGPCNDLGGSEMEAVIKDVQTRPDTTTSN